MWTELWEPTIAVHVVILLMVRVRLVVVRVRLIVVSGLGSGGPVVVFALSPRSEESCLLHLLDLLAVMERYAVEVYATVSIGGSEGEGSVRVAMVCELT